MHIVKGAASGAPILILSKTTSVFLRRGFDDALPDRLMNQSFSGNHPYDKPLTDEEEAIAMKWILTHGG